MAGSPHTVGRSPANDQLPTPHDGHRFRARYRGAVLDCVRVPVFGSDRGRLMTPWAQRKAALGAFAIAQRSCAEIFAGLIERHAASLPELKAMHALSLYQLLQLNPPHVALDPKPEDIGALADYLVDTARATNELIEQIGIEAQVDAEDFEEGFEKVIVGAVCDALGILEDLVEELEEEESSPVVDLNKYTGRTN